MIDRQANRILIECDTCEDVFHGDEGEEWATVWAKARREGWSSRSHKPLRGQKQGEWTHGCPRHEA